MEPEILTGQVPTIQERAMTERTIGERRALEQQAEQAEQAPAPKRTRLGGTFEETTNVPIRAEEQPPIVIPPITPVTKNPTVPQNVTNIITPLEAQRLQLEQQVPILETLASTAQFPIEEYRSLIEEVGQLRAQIQYLTRQREALQALYSESAFAAQRQELLEQLRNIGVARQQLQVNYDEATRRLDDLQAYIDRVNSIIQTNTQLIEQSVTAQTSLSTFLSTFYDQVGKYANQYYTGERNTPIEDIINPLNSEIFNATLTMGMNPTVAIKAFPESPPPMNQITIGDFDIFVREIYGNYVNSYIQEEFVDRVNRRIDRGQQIRDQLAPLSESTNNKNRAIAQNYLGLINNEITNLTIRRDSFRAMITNGTITKEFTQMMEPVQRYLGIISSLKETGLCNNPQQTRQPPPLRPNVIYVAFLTCAQGVGLNEVPRNLHIPYKGYIYAQILRSYWFQIWNLALISLDSDIGDNGKNALEMFQGLTNGIEYLRTSQLITELTTTSELTPESNIFMIQLLMAFSRKFNLTADTINNISGIISTAGGIDVVPNFCKVFTDAITGIYSPRKVFNTDLFIDGCTNQRDALQRFLRFPLPPWDTIQYTQFGDEIVTNLPVSNVQLNTNSYWVRPTARLPTIPLV